MTSVIFGEWKWERKGLEKSLYADSLHFMPLDDGQESFNMRCGAMRTVRACEAVQQLTHIPNITDNSTSEHARTLLARPYAGGNVLR